MSVDGAIEMHGYMILLGGLVTCLGFMSLAILFSKLP